MDHFEDVIFSYLDRAKLLFFPEQWNSFFFNCSKNEMFILLLLYRKKEVTMTEIADYVHVPLNTATGIVGRMEKKELLQRERSESDKRVVTVAMTTYGITVMKEFLDQVLSYSDTIINELTKEEITVVTKVIDKVINRLQQKETFNSQKETEKNKEPAKMKKIEIK